MRRGRSRRISTKAGARAWPLRTPAAPRSALLRAAGGEQPRRPNHLWSAFGPPLKFPLARSILVSMTRNAKSPPPKPAKPRRRERQLRAGHWLLQDAKARFSELVRRVRSEGPQHVTVHGRDEVVVISAEEFRRLKGDLTGASLIAAMQASPHRDIDIEPKRAAMPVREVSF